MAVGRITRLRLSRGVCCRQNYEAKIDALQKQVEEQSMTMSMYSSYTATDDFAPEEDIYGE